MTQSRAVALPFLALAKIPASPGGRRRLAGRGGPQGRPGRQTKERRPGPLAPGRRSFRALCARRRPPGDAGIFLSPREPFANLFPPRKPTHKTSPPLPVSGGPAYAVGKPKKLSSQFSPAFLKAGRGGGAERRQWRKKRGGSPVSKGVEGSRLGGDAQRPLRTAGAERRQWRKKRGGSPVSKGVEGCRLGGDAQRPLRTARGAGSPPHSDPQRPLGNCVRGWQPPYNPPQYDPLLMI